MTSNDENRQVNGFLWLYMIILLPGKVLMNGFRPGMADAAVISNNGIRHVRASDITRYGKMRFCFGTAQVAFVTF
jgi:hypothetical protein